MKITERTTKTDWAKFIKEIADEHYQEAEKIALVLGNLKTHVASVLYEVYLSNEAKRIWGRFNFISPKHGSWLNMAEIELNIL